jgi:hypothetical protein
MNARLKLWLEATASMQGRLLLRAMIADVGGEQVAARCCTDEELGGDMWLRANRAHPRKTAQRRLTSNTNGKLRKQSSAK